MVARSVCIAFVSPNNSENCNRCKQNDNYCRSSCCRGSPLLVATNTAITDTTASKAVAVFAKHWAKVCNVHLATKLDCAAFGVGKKGAVRRINLFGRARVSDIAITVAKVGFTAVSPTHLTIETTNNFMLQFSWRGCRGCGCGGGGGLCRCGRSECRCGTGF